MKNSPPVPASLRHAAALGNSDEVQRLLQAGTPVNEFDNAPLRAALRHRHAAIVRILISAGAVIGENADEFLEIAAKNGDAASLKILLDSMNIPILPNVLDRIFYAAIAAKNPAAVKILLRAGANPTSGKHRPVQEAACAGSVDILKLLHRHGADLDAREGQPLFNAVVGEHFNAIKFLILSGVDVNARLGISIALAVSNGHAEIVELLVAAGAKLAHPAQIADAAHSDSLETLLLLQHYGYELHPYADETVTEAGKNAAPRVLKYVLEREVVHPLTLADALENAVRKACEPCVDILISHGAIPCLNKSQCLKLAIEQHEMVIARKLIAAGSLVTDLEASALFHTAQAGDWDFLLLLLRHGIATMPVHFSQSHALEFFRRVTPQMLLRDHEGTCFPASIRQERQIFAQNIGAVAAQQSGDDAITVACWLTKFMIEMNSIV